MKIPHFPARTAPSRDNRNQYVQPQASRLLPLPDWRAGLHFQPARFFLQGEFSQPHGYVSQFEPPPLRSSGSARLIGWECFGESWNGSNKTQF
jgi:hypothetical protein